jgi:hypothetical protein
VKKKVVYSFKVPINEHGEVDIESPKIPTEKKGYNTFPIYSY